jgi:small subunit ribosomal protein S4
VNGRKASIPSQRLKPGDVFAVRERSRNMLVFNELRPSVNPPDYVQLEADGYSARYLRTPERIEIPILCQENMVVEYYSR